MSKAGQLWSSVRRVLARNDRVVDFVVGGTQKGGTTALDAFLREHPELCLAERKEVHFFDDERWFGEHAVDYRRYHSAFFPTKAHTLVGESTPIYMYWQAAPERIHAYNPSMKWILVLRDPIERAYSHWNMETQRNAECLPFEDAIRTEQQRCRSALPLQHRVYSYVDRGFYLRQLQRIWELFGREQVLVLKNEDLRARPKQALEQVWQFLGVEPLEVHTREVHARPYAEPIPESARDYLRSVYEADIRGLEAALGWDCSAWLAPSSA